MKRKTLIWFVLFLTTLVLFGCKKKEYIVDFGVENRAGDRLFVILQKTESSSIDTSFIGFGHKHIVHVEMGENSTSEKYVFDLEELPFHFIEVQNTAGNSMLCDENTLTCWSRISNKNSKMFGSVVLSVNSDSF